jgi:Phosphotyrosyl phosphate activator (PTPA) protein
VKVKVCAGRPGTIHSNYSTMTSFRALEKAIISKEQLVAFKTSKVYARITSYVDTLNNAVVGLKLSDGGEQSQVRRRALALLVGLLTDRGLS